jgi:hypothetical protein
LSPDGGIGRRGGFKIRFRKKWEFDSPSGHHDTFQAAAQCSLNTKKPAIAPVFLCLLFSKSHLIRIYTPFLNLYCKQLTLDNQATRLS